MRNNMNFFDALKQYLTSRWEYHYLSFVERLAVLVSTIVLLFFMAILALVLVLLFTFLGYELLMNVIGISWLVVLTEIFIMLLMMCLLWVFREKLVIAPLGGMIVRILFNSKKETDE